MSLALQTRQRSGLCGVVVLLCGLFSAPTVTFGQSADAQRATEAQTLFEQAVVEMDAGQFATACKKFEEVTRLVPDGVGGKYALGKCYERLGKLASAWTQFSFAQQVALRLGQTDRAEDAKAKADALKPKLATLMVVVPDALRKVPGILVQRDGMELREPQWGTAIYVDAGGHNVVVTAPGYTKWEREVEVLTDGVAVKASVPENAIAVDPNAAQAGSARIVPVFLPPPPPDRTWQRPAGIVSTGVGLTTLVAGGILGGLAISEKNTSNEGGHCDAVTNQCDDTGLVHRDRAIALGNVATGMFVAGAIVTVGGALIWITAPSKTNAKPIEKKAAENRPRMGLRLAPGWMGLAGTF